MTAAASHADPDSPAPATASTPATPAITVRGLGKRYRAYGGPVARLREVLTGRPPAGREFTALRDVSFEIAPGTALGVVGPNGAGKSTLLKILAGIVDPSEGTVAIRGRIASIIELGAGFHPDFTGRENVFLNAGLAGIPERETRAAYDGIARFCELGPYLDMPVKTYSSGMFVRLAFAVAVAARPDVLLVDEALAVGDAVFGHRCLARIRAMREEGTTIVLVTHDTNTVAGLCDRALFIDKGRVVADGDPKDVTHRYLLHVAERLTTLDQRGEAAAAFHEVGASEDGADAERRFGTFEARIVKAAVEDSAGLPAERLVGGTEATLRMAVKFDRDIDRPVFGVMIRNRFGVEIFGTNTARRKIDTGRWAAGETADVAFRVPMLLGAGSYAASFAAHTEDGRFFDYRVDVRAFEVLAGDEAIGAVHLPAAVEVTRTQPGSDGEKATDGDGGLDDALARAYPDARATVTVGEGCGRFLGGAWHDAHPDAELPEATPMARWMGDSGTVTLRIPAGAVTLEVLTRSHDPSETAHGPVTLSASLHGRTLAPGPVAVAAGDGWITARFDLGAAGGSGLSAARVAMVYLTSSRTWRPADTVPGSADDRRLGVMVASVRAA